MASDNDIKSAQQSYEGFLFLMKWGTILSLLVAAMVVLIIA